MLRVSTQAVEGALKVSKLLKLPVLLDDVEMAELLVSMPECFFYNSEGISKKGEGVFSKRDFLEAYKEYVLPLKEGKIGKRPLSTFLSCDESLLYAIDVDVSSYIIKAKRPVIMLQENRIHYSKEDQTFHSQVFGSSLISWGIYFSYPQIYQDPFSQEIFDVDESSLFPNTALFKQVQKWMRNNTLPTPFVVEGKRVNVPIRLGKKCFSWIGKHPGLKERGIEVFGAT